MQLMFLTTLLLGALLLLGVAFLMIDSRKAENGEIKITYNYNDLIGQPTDTVVSRLEELGFTNVEIQEENEFTWGIGKESGEVTSIWSDGAIIGSGNYFEPNAPIIVKYKN